MGGFFVNYMNYKNITNLVQMVFIHWYIHPLEFQPVVDSIGQV